MSEFAQQQAIKAARETDVKEEAQQVGKITVEFEQSTTRGVDVSLSECEKSLFGTA